MFKPVQLGIDLGTSNVQTYTKKKGLLYNEPTIAAIREETGECEAFGYKAELLLKEQPDAFRGSRPLENGVMADDAVTLEMLTFLIKSSLKKVGGSLRKPNVVLCVAPNLTSVEKRAVKKAVLLSGASTIRLIEEPAACALGTDIKAESASAHFIASIGGGTASSAVICSGRSAASSSIRAGGSDLDRAITDYLYHTYSVIVTRSAAENLKIDIGSSPGYHNYKQSVIRGLDRKSGLPRSIAVSSREIQKVLEKPLHQVLENIENTIASCPPELSGDLIDRGLLLSGGTSLLPGLAEWFSQSLNLPVHSTQDPFETAARGTGAAFNLFNESNE
ncbi:rod shape-determining protein [Alkalicoccus halolimnae]|uniref:Rod shape-determining protein n=1 Tax=Alkalicoccus halolimnae TaxID=1667239 RepID=A0A5C7FFV3_9BACI|nr:rod shape-determining protein [Alkalicoccus halolimnae]TXF85099.1 rod shape-determining protein [Alkalicoccus halolimnae]